jgi:hypothetical protein
MLVEVGFAVVLKIGTMLQSYEVSKQMLGRERDGGIGI